MPVPALLALTAVAVLWGSAFPLIKVGLEGLSVPHLTLVRHLIASAAFVPVLLAARKRLLPRRRDAPFFVLLGTLGMFVYHLGLNAGELRVSAGAASLIIASAPALTALFAWALIGERLPAAGWAGSLVAFAGVALIVLGDSAGFSFDPFAGFVLLAAVSTSLYFVLQGRMFSRYAAVQVTAFVTWGGTLPMLVFLPGLAGDVADAPRSALTAAAYIGLFPSALAYTLFAFAQSRAPVTQVTTFLYTVPIFSLLLSWWWLGEVPTALTAIGGVVAIAGIVVVNRSRRPRTPRRAVVRG